MDSRAGLAYPWKGTAIPAPGSGTPGIAEEGKMKRLHALLFMGLLCIGLHRCESVQVGATDPVKTPVKTDTTTYVCSGKTTCPEMRTCAEAEFYLDHCPGTSMDGDLDGIPCEDQLCGH